MASFWNKLKDFFQQDDANESLEDDDGLDISYAQPLSLDEKFAQYFTQAGGHFLYCENQQIALRYLKDILETENISRFICFDESLQKMLDTLNANYINYPSATADFCFLHCESLISYNGSIMLSANVTSCRKLSDLPCNFIIFAHYHQIVDQLGDGLKVILSKNKNGQMPSNITSIGGVDAKQVNNNQEDKIIYLLLLD